MCDICACSRAVDNIDKNFGGTYMASISDDLGYLNCVIVIVSFRTIGILQVSIDA